MINMSNKRHMLKLSYSHQKPVRDII